MHSSCWFSMAQCPFPRRSTLFRSTLGQWLMHLMDCWYPKKEIYYNSLLFEEWKTDWVQDSAPFQVQLGKCCWCLFLQTFLSAISPFGEILRTEFSDAHPEGGDKICNFWQLEKATHTHPKYVHNSIHDSAVFDQLLVRTATW